MLDGLFQPMHLLVIFFIALLVFGPKKIADLGKGLGQGIREFKNAVNDGSQAPAVSSSTQSESNKPNPS